jgi:GNAT superfamily N-acetyltransferase
MTEQKAAFIKVPTDNTDGFQTMPVEPSRRLPESDMRIELCTEQDAEKIAEGLYLCFPDDWWAKKEPLELRPKENSDRLRIQRMAKRLTPAITDPNHSFIKAVLTSTGEIVGIAGWTRPSNPGVHNMFRRSAIDHYGWKEKMGWTDEEIEEMWSHVSDETWNVQFGKDDETRREITEGQPHWYLAPLLTWPDYQGRGVGKRLLNWAIEQADVNDPPTPMYLESRPSARAVYMHMGFVPCGDYNMLRKGPAVVKGLEAEDEGRKEGDKVKLEGISVEVAEKNTQVDIAG